MLEKARSVYSSKYNKNVKKIKLKNSNFHLSKL